MPGTIEASVVIPVFNQWRLTRQCLEALAGTTAGESVEVIVIDNASTDETAQACPALGGGLFGGRFVYRRAEKNLNFGPASNLGARIARGATLIFLNNDTEPLPGWYRPLLRDLDELPDVAATGPVLLYPDGGRDGAGEDGRNGRPGRRSIFGRTVQHLGVYVTPFLSVGHLYEGIPGDSPLAKKRRFFQIITAACMAMRADLFRQAGGFDERYVNGFEDVDLCARLWSRGLRMTVNPDSRVVHLTSQTAGRYGHDAENSRLLAQNAQPLLAPDLHVHVANDGLRLALCPWQRLRPALPKPLADRLRRFLPGDGARADREALTRLLTLNPYWDAGLEILAAHAASPAARRSVLEYAVALLHRPEDNLALHALCRETGDNARADGCLKAARAVADPFAAFLAAAQAGAGWCASIGLDDVAALYRDWLARADEIRQSVHEPFMRRLEEIRR